MVNKKLALHLARTIGGLSVAGASRADHYRRGYEAGIEAAAAMLEQRAREAYGKADALAAMQPAFSPATRNEREHAILAHELEELAGKIRKLGGSTCG